MPTGKPTKEQNTSIETHPMIAETEIKVSVQYNLEPCKLFCSSDFLIYLFLQ